MKYKTDTLILLDEMIYRDLHKPKHRARLSRAMKIQNQIIDYRKTAGKLPGQVGKS